MARMFIDCRELPNTVGCTLRISGEKDELLKASIQHAVQVHGDADTPDLHEELRDAMRLEPSETVCPPAEPIPMPATIY